MLLSPGEIIYQILSEIIKKTCDPLLSCTLYLYVCLATLLNITIIIIILIAIIM